MKVAITPTLARGKITAPPSKSMAHRLLICAGLSDGVSTIRGVSDCDDVEATIGALASLGIKCLHSGNDVTVYGKSVEDIVPNAPIFCRESGSTMRFFIPIALLTDKKIKFTGAKTLLARPMSVYQNICDKFGYEFIHDEDGITVCGKLGGGIYEIPGGISSQFISGMLFALPFSPADSEIRITKPIESILYIKMTISALKSFGVIADFDEELGIIRIPGNQKYTPADITVEGDYSGTAFIEALNYLGGEVEIEGLNPDTLQADAIYTEYFKLIEIGTPTLDISNCPDLAPILFALAAIKNGAKFTGTRRLKIKESDRAMAMKLELEKLGAELTVFENEVVVKKCELHSPTVAINAHNDHRIVMSLAVLLTKLGGEITGAEAVRKSYPDFFLELKRLGINIEKYEN